MPRYIITFSRAATKEIEGLPLRLANRISRKIDGLEQDPRPPGCRKLRSPKELWRIRIGDYRVIYSIDDSNGVVDIVYVRHRRNAYE
jgi:mRNA interferase RelE/StbE